LRVDWLEADVPAEGAAEGAGVAQQQQEQQQLSARS
jgi:hypothetical protein